MNITWISDEAQGPFVLEITMCDFAICKADGLQLM
jgi:hypothetical protein